MKGFTRRDIDGNIIDKVGIEGGAATSVIGYKRRR